MEVNKKASKKYEEQNFNFSLYTKPTKFEN